MATDPTALTITAPATSANLGPGFDVLALALDLANEVIVRRRPGPLEVHVEGEGAGEVPEDEGNLLCRAMLMGLADLDGLEITCRNRIPFGRGLGLTNLARIGSRQHWLSDTVAGSLLGYGIGQFFYQSSRAPKSKGEPKVSLDPSGVSLAWQW